MLPLPTMTSSGATRQRRAIASRRVRGTVAYRFKRIARIEVCDPATAPAELQLYNLVLAGSHTMRVDGYLVTGWPQEADFDYDAWRLKPGVRFVHPRRSIIRAA